MIATSKWPPTQVSISSCSEKVREYRLFAKDKSKAVKDKMIGAMANVIERINGQLGGVVQATSETRSRVTKHGIVAKQKLVQLHQTMSKLVPQIRYWLKTGYVAAGKIINLHVPELYAIVRGKVGKKVEFGLSWGITRLRGGFLLARLAAHRNELVHAEFAVKAVRDFISLFGKAPRAYAYDRAGYSAENVATLKELGVRQVGLAPRGRCQWAVGEKTKRKLVQERALVEAGIGSVKSSRYNFHRPRAKSMRMMGACGQLGVLGFNLNKMVRGFAARAKLAAVIG
jgi:hypothetical protein